MPEVLLHDIRAGKSCKKRHKKSAPEHGEISESARKCEQKKGVSLHDTRGRGNHQKLTKTYTKKRVYEHDTGAGEYQDILDTLKADC